MQYNGHFQMEKMSYKSKFLVDLSSFRGTTVNNTHIITFFVCSLKNKREREKKSCEWTVYLFSKDFITVYFNIIKFCNNLSNAGKNSYAERVFAHFLDFGFFFFFKCLKCKLYFYIIDLIMLFLDSNSVLCCDRFCVMPW